MPTGNISGRYQLGDASSFLACVANAVIIF